MSARGPQKTTTHPSGGVLAGAAGISKRALLDLLGDALDLQHGDEQWGWSELREWVNPRLEARGDKLLPSVNPRMRKAANQ